MCAHSTSMDSASSELTVEDNISKTYALKKVVKLKSVPLDILEYVDIIEIMAIANLENGASSNMKHQISQMK